jgi:hypothetical protein
MIEVSLLMCLNLAARRSPTADDEAISFYPFAWPALYDQLSVLEGQKNSNLVLILRHYGSSPHIILYISL